MPQAPPVRPALAAAKADPWFRARPAAVPPGPAPARSVRAGVRRRIQTVGRNVIGPAQRLRQMRLRASSCGRARAPDGRAPAAGWALPRHPAAAPAGGRAAAARWRPQRCASQPSRRAASSASSNTRVSPGAESTASSRSSASSMAASSAITTNCGSAACRTLWLQAVRVIFQDQLHICMRQRLAQAFARRTGAGQQGDGRGRMGFTHGHGRSPAGRTRYASGPVPGTACPDTAGHRSRRRAGGACRRCAR